MKVLIVNKYWKISVRSDAVHNKSYPCTHAIAILEDRHIHVRRSSLNKVTLIHELIHAYQSELSFWELQLDDDQIDEWFAELFGKYGEDIIDQSNAVLRKYEIKN